MLNTYAVFSSTASTSRKSNFSAPGTISRFQVVPPSAVRSTVPSAPLAHATRSFTALTPRNRAETPLIRTVHSCPNPARPNPKINKIRISPA